MKLSIGLVVAAAHAAENRAKRVARSTHTEWMVNQWWAEAVDVFNFSHDNFEAFESAVDSVSDMIKVLYQ